MGMVRLALFGAVLFGLAACGDTSLERGLSGAAIGAVTAEAVGEDPVVGATVGGAVGVLTK